MRLSISNLAWEAQHDAAVAAVLADAAVDAIDIAPGRYFSDPTRVPLADAERIRATWAARGVEIVGMQALLFGTQGLNLFGDDASRRAMLDHLVAVCRLGDRLGARRLVFGSPRNRDATGWEGAAAFAHAVAFFQELAGQAEAAGVAICLEPNPARYQCNFMTNTAEAAAVVRAVDRPGIRLQLDTGAWAVNDEPARLVLARDAVLVGHVHASEPDLVPLGDGGIDHAAYAAAIRESLPGAIVTIEMLPGADRVATVRQAIAVARATYGQPGTST